MYTTHPTTTPAGTPLSRVEQDPWLLWRLETPDQPVMLTIAELAECCCPDLCDRDHANE